VVKFALRPPTNSKKFNKIGGSATFTYTKPLTKKLTATTSLDLIYHPLDEDDFNATDLEIKDFYKNVRAALIYDPFAPGGFYMSLGAAYTESNIEYKDTLNNTSDDSIVLYGQVNAKIFGISSFVGVSEELFLDHTTYQWNPHESDLQVKIGANVLSW